MTKKIIKWITGALFILSLFTACDDSFLDEKVLDTYAPDALKDKLGFEASIIGLYNQLSIFYTTDQDQTLNGIWNLGTDIAWAPAGRSNGNARPYFDYQQLTPTDEASRKLWGYLYKLINNANIIIANAESGQAVGMTEAEIRPYNAEARFFRAHAYNMLATLYGDVPLLTEPLTTIRTDFVRDPVAAVNGVIVNDLIFAAAHLPEIDKAVSGRANKYMAHQLLAEVYLRSGENTKAEKHCDTIISSGKFSLVKNRYGVKASAGGDPFSDMFIYKNMRRKQGNTEAIWVFELENPTDVPGGATSFPQQRRIWVSAYYDIKGMQPTDSLGGRGIARMRLNDWVLYQLYEPNDMRNSQYSIKRQLYFNSPDRLFDQIRGLPVPYGQNAIFPVVDPTNPSRKDTVKIFASDTVWRIPPYTMKWGHYDIRDNFGYGMWKDFIFMRLGETYLLRAEARFKQNNLQGAADDLNVIRGRANASQIEPDDVDLDFILDERARELLAEENRRMTLVRTGTLVDRARNLSGTGPLAGGQIETTNGLEAKHMLLPIPQTEIDLNKDAVLEQNNGYD